MLFQRCARFSSPCQENAAMALEIAPEKVAHVIIKAREYDVKVGAWDD
jgi:hypothetical protein